MVRSDRLYFDWLCSLVADQQQASCYQQLLTYLDKVAFRYILSMDLNRAADGVDLRYRYESECLIECSRQGPCSVLEMMVALSVRCEEHIMADPDMGNQTSRWFWEMIDSLGLYSQDDRNFEEAYVQETVNCFLDREYKFNGEGGLFTLAHPRRDLRNVEIWCQLCWYLDELIYS